MFTRPEDAKPQSRLVYEVVVAQGACASSFFRAALEALGTWHLARLGAAQATIARVSTGIVADHPPTHSPIHRRYDESPRDAARRVRRVPRRRVSPFFSMSPGARH